MNKTVKNSAVYMSGTIIMAILGFASTMILTRILSTRVYAMYGLLNTFSTAVIMFISFGYDSSYMRFYYSHGYSQKKFMMMSLKIPIIIFLAFALLVLEPTHTLVKYIFDENLSFFTVGVLLIYIFFSFVHRFSQLTSRMEEYAGNYIFSNIVAKSGFILFVLVFFVLLKKVSFQLVLISFALSNIAAVLINLKVFCKVSDKVSVSEKCVTNRELLSYGLPFMVNSVLVLVIPVIEKLIIRDLAGWEILSIFTAAAIFQTVIMLVTNTLENIWNPVVYKNCEKPEVFKPIMHIFGFATVIVLTLGLAACILLRRWLVLLLGKNYFSVYIIAPVILYGACINVISIVYSIGINIKKKTIHFIISPLIQAVASFLLCFLLIPSMGLIGIGIASLASIAASRIYRIIVGIHYYNTGASEWKSVLLCAIGTAVSVMSLYFTSLKFDIIAFAVLVLSLAVIVNKDIFALSNTMIGLFAKKNDNNKIEEA